MSTELQHLSGLGILEALKATKKRVIKPDPKGKGTIYPTVVETTIWTDAEIEQLKKMLLKKKGRL